MMTVDQIAAADRKLLDKRWEALFDHVPPAKLQAGLVRRENGSQVLDLNVPGAAGDIQIPAAGTRLFLEHGILVEFGLAPAGGQFKSGDHWVFAARTVDASIEIGRAHV